MAAKQIRVVRLGHVVYQHPDLERALSFLRDFGFVEESRTADRAYLRGYGAQPFVYVAERSPDGQRHFMGGYWVVDAPQDLAAAAAHPDASPVTAIDGPGGGQMVTITDPNGLLVGFLHGQGLRAAEADAPIAVPPLEETAPTFNGAVDKPRKGAFRRFKQGPSPIHKLGHYGFVVPGDRFEATRSWYMSLMNFQPTDAVYNPATGLDETCFFHIDLGPDYTDHHSFFLAAGPNERAAHIHHSSYEIDNFDAQTLGHDWLRDKGWTNCWGIGRHVLGSQIFDYWFDCSGNIVEHYSDGDVVNEHTPFTRSAAAPDSLHVWGPNLPLAFLSGRMEDVGKPLPIPPDVVAGKPADLLAAA